MAGRFFTLFLKPLTFIEFLEMKKLTADKLQTSARRIAILFNEYLLKAGFPEIVEWDNEKRIVEYVRDSVIHRVIFKDVPTVFGTRNPRLMTTLIKHLMSNPGNVVNLTTSQNPGRRQELPSPTI